MITLENLALDLRSSEYQLKSNPKARIALAADIASYAGELGRQINPLSWRVEDNGRVTDILRGGRDVREQFSYKDALQRTESDAGKMIVDALLNEPEGTACIWISPSGGPKNYPLARITAGLVKKDLEVKGLEGYGIEANLSADECLVAGQLLSSFSLNRPTLFDSESLRGHVFLLGTEVYNGSSPWDLMARVLPLPAWEQIKSREAHSEFQQRVEKALPIVDQFLSKIQGNKSDLEILKIGIKSDEAMERTYGVTPGSGGCGSSYKQSAYKLLFATLKSDGTIVSESTAEGKFVRNCGCCGIPINKVIPRGYICRVCGGEYKGC